MAKPYYRNYTARTEEMHLRCTPMQKMKLVELSRELHKSRTQVVCDIVDDLYQELIENQKKDA